MYTHTDRRLVACAGALKFPGYKVCGEERKKKKERKKERKKKENVLSIVRKIE